MSFRITPAGAGKTLTIAALALIGEDHPRRCGENLTVFQLCPKNPGSPPQVRGKLQRFQSEISQLGITPAGAGKTPYRCSRHQADRDHPRRCGENRIHCNAVGRNPGSPPQVRGKHKRDQYYQREVRITPAGAGKTVLCCRCCYKLWDHPRGCGENDSVPHATGGLPGSPPRMRGKRPSSSTRT